MSEQPTIHKLPTNPLSAQQTADIRALLWAAFADDEHGAFTEDDWQHSIGGTHFIAVVAGEIVCPRVGRRADAPRRWRAVADRLRRGGRDDAWSSGTGLWNAQSCARLMRSSSDAFELGALGTGSQGFYERLGWQIWRGPSSVQDRHW